MLLGEPSPEFAQLLILVLLKQLQPESAGVNVSRCEANIFRLKLAS